MWITRLVLAFALSAPYALINFVAPVLGTQRYTFSVSMDVPTAGTAQLFFDRGSGFLERDSSRAVVSPGLQRYQFAVPLGTVQGLRLDPGDVGGRYTISSAEILRPDHSRLSSVPLSPVTTLNQLRIVEHNPSRIVLDSPAGSGDPFLVLRLSAPLTLEPLRYSEAALVARVLAVWLAALAIVLAAEQVGRRFGPSWSMIRQQLRLWRPDSPFVVILLVATGATTAATYPLLFANRSLVAPGNGGTLMLYDRPPFVPGGHDYGIEDVRGSDVGATMWAFVPYSKLQREAIAHGEWPLWIRNNGAGRPLWGQGQTFLFDPLHWLTLLAADPSRGWDLKFVAHRLVFAVGIGAAALLATGSLPASSVAVAVTPFVGLYAFRFNHPGAFAPTYAPWILVAWILLGRATTWRARWRGALILAAATSLTLFASPPKEGLLMIAGSCLAGVLMMLLGELSPIDIARGFFAAGIGGLIAALITSPHWLVFLETLHAARTGYDIPTLQLAGWDSALGLVLGNLTPGTLQPGLNPVAAALALSALAAPAAYFRTHKPLAACALATTGLIALAFGAAPDAWLLRLPLIGNIGHFADVALTAVTVPALVLAAAGAQTLYDAERWARARIVVMLAVLAAILLHQTGGSAATEPAHQWALVCLSAVVCAIPFILAALRRHPTRALPAICLVVIVAGLSELGGLHLPTGVTPLDALLLQPRPREPLNLQSSATIRARNAMREPTRVVGLGMLLFQGTQELYGLEGIGGPDALEVGAYEDLLDAGGVGRPWPWLTLVSADQMNRTAPLLDLLNVGMVVTHQDELPPGLVKGPVDDDPLVDVAARPSAWPRAFFVDGVRKYAAPADLLQLVAAGHGPLAGVALSDAAGVRATAGLSEIEHAASPATNYKLSVNSTSFRVRASGPGVAVLTETYLSDDFRALLNGRPVPYFRVNHAFNGVVVPGAGTWDVQFVYRPAHWTAAWWAAGLGSALTFLLLAAAFRRRVTPTIESRDDHAYCS